MRYTFAVSRLPLLLAIAIVALGAWALPARAAGTCVTGTTKVTCTFSHTGQVDAFTVPAGVTRLWVTAVGGGGGGTGDAPWSASGGTGATVRVTNVPVTPGDSLLVYVGGGGARGYTMCTGEYGVSECRFSSGGGGGGATLLRFGGVFDIVAGGGGGAGGAGTYGGDGGVNANGKGGKGEATGLPGGCVGTGGGGTSAVGGTGDTPGCNAGGDGVSGRGGAASGPTLVAGGSSSDLGGNGGAGRWGQIPESGTFVYHSGGGGGGWGGGAGGYIGGAGGAGGSIATSSLGALSASTVTYSAEAANGGTTATNDAAEDGSLTISYPLLAQTITRTSAEPSQTTWRYASTYQIEATGGASGNPLTYAVTADATSVCSVSAAGLITFNQRGACRVEIRQAATEEYAEGYLQLSASVGKGTQTITFTSTAADPRVNGTYVPTATGGGSGAPLVLSVASGCTLLNGTVTFTNRGTCRVRADQVGDTNYEAAAQAEQVIDVGQGLQAITFTSSAPSPVYGDGSSYAPSATGGDSGEPLNLAIDFGSSGVCQLSSGTVTFQHAGTCTLNATQWGNWNWAAAPQVQQHITVARQPQTVAFTSSAPSPVYGDVSSYTPTASGGGSGNARTFTIDASSSGICAISEGDVTFQHAGTCTVNADQDGTTDYLPAPRVQQEITVARQPQTVAFTSSAPSPVYGDASSYTPTASGGGSGNARSFTIDSASAAVCSISSGVVTFQHAGTCTVNADQNGTTDYLAAPASSRRSPSTGPRRRSPSRARPRHRASTARTRRRPRTAAAASRASSRLTAEALPCARSAAAS